MPPFEKPISGNEQRDHLANVRTMLSWVRTAVTVMGLGFVVAKFGLVLDQMPGHHHSLGIHLAGILGTALVLGAAGILLAAIAEFTWVSKAIRTGTVYFRSWIPMTLSCLLIAVGVVLAVYIVLTS